MSGFDKLQRQLADAQRALSALGTELTTVHFKPDDPESIEGAIQKVSQTIDERVGHYADNPFVRPLIDQMKDHFREAILDRAAAARLEHDGEDVE